MGPFCDPGCPAMTIMHGTRTRNRAEHTPHSYGIRPLMESPGKNMKTQIYSHWHACIYRQNSLHIPSQDCVAHGVTS